jgi:hypothetical protein
MASYFEESIAAAVDTIADIKAASDVPIEVCIDVSISIFRD